MFKTKQQPKQEPKKYSGNPTLKDIYTRLGFLWAYVCIAFCTVVLMIGLLHCEVSQTNTLLSTFQRVDTVKEESKMKHDYPPNTGSLEEFLKGCVNNTGTAKDEIDPETIGHGNSYECPEDTHWTKCDKQEGPCAGFHMCGGVFSSKSAPQAQTTDGYPITSCNCKNGVEDCRKCNSAYLNEDDPNLCTHWKTDCHAAGDPGSCSVICELGNE